MKVAVWDTFVLRNDGKTMHFDILVPEVMNYEAKVYEYGNIYLLGIPIQIEKLSSRECNFCHIEDALPEIVVSIENKGFHIVEMENCHE